MPVTSSQTDLLNDLEKMENAPAPKRPKNKKLRRIVIGGAAGLALAGTAAALIIANLPNPSGSHGISAVVKKVNNAASGNVDISGKLPPQLVKLINNPATNKDLLNAISGLQASVAAAQKAPGSNAAEQQNLATIAPLLSTFKFIVQDKCVIPASNVSNVLAVVHGKQKYEAAFGSLFSELKQGNPAAITFVDSFTANGQAVNAVAQLAAATSSPIFKDLGFSPAQEKGFMNAVGVLEDQPLRTDFIAAASAAENGITAAQATKSATPAQEKYLADIAKVLPIIKSALQDQGHLSPADTAGIASLIHNEAGYQAAITSLVNDYRAGAPAAVTFVNTFKTDDPAGISLAQAFAAKASASLPPTSTVAQGADRLGLNLLSPQNFNALKSLGINGKTQASARAFLQNRQS